MPAPRKQKRADIAQISAESGRKPPQAIEIEEAVLAAMMLENDVVADCLDQLNDKCFYKEANRKIFEAIREIASRNDKVDILTVADELSRRGTLEEVGGAAYLSEMSMRISAASNTDYHCKILLQKFIQRCNTSKGNRKMDARTYLEILHVAEKLKDTPRHCTTSKGKPESVAEHSWRNIAYADRI